MWEDSFAERAEYRQRELQSVSAKNSCAKDGTFQVPNQMDWDGAATLTIETGVGRLSPKIVYDPT